MLSVFEKEIDDIHRKKKLIKDGDNSRYYVETFNDFIEKVNNRRLILYGCGMGGYAVGDWLKSLGISVDGFADSKRTGVFPFSGEPIISLHDLLEKHKDANVLISSKNHCAEIYDMLLSSGFPAEQIIPFPELFPKMPDCGTKIADIDGFVSKHLDGYEWAYKFFDDEESKRVIIGRLNAWLLGIGLEASNDYPEYFDRDIVTIGESEVFVDGGGYCGDSIYSIINETNGRFRHIYTFEPDSNKCKMMQTEFNQYKNVTIIPKGLWSKEAKLPINLAGSSSSIVFDVSDNTKVINVISLDNFFNDIEFPTFIKMDIEGSELEALHGSEQIIRESKPKLAICAYHKPEDIYTLPQLVYNYNPTYTYYLRQARNGITDTILYAV